MSVLVPSPDGKHAVAGTYDHTSAYDLTTGRRLWRAEHADYEIAVLADNELDLAAAGGPSARVGP